MSNRLEVAEAIGQNTLQRYRAIDLFCGAGGSSWGAQAAGVEIVAAFDAWPLAGKAHHDNFPCAKFYEGRLEELDVEVVAKEIGKIDLMLASPECTNHSPAKGNKPRCEASKDTAFQVTRFAKVFQPRWIVIENVVNMRKWTRYKEFKKELRKLGYKLKEQVLKASDFGVPQSRRRLFLLCDKQAKPQSVSKPCEPAVIHVKDILEPNGTYRFTPLRKKGRAKATLERADRAIARVGKNNPFLIVYYGSDGAGGWQKLNRPLRTVTTVDRFAFVKKENGEHVMRMLQVPELQAAMGMNGMAFKHGTRRDRIKMLGNAVCPPVMRTVIETIVARS